MRLTPSNSKTQIDRAGVTLREWWESGRPGDEYGTDPPEIDDALGVLWDFRACFAEPLRKTIMGFRYMVQAEGGELAGDRQVTQRLKRLPAIVNKLSRHPSMRLSQMQDIGGCRAILPDGSDEVSRVAHRIQQRWRVMSVDDYATAPQPITGYRALHVIVEREERLVEIQLRTVWQQRWAEQVERSQRILGEDLKDGVGPDDVLEYYERLSHGMAIAETGGDLDPEFLDDLDQRGANVRALIAKHRGG